MSTIPPPPPAEGGPSVPPPPPWSGPTAGGPVPPPPTHNTPIPSLDAYPGLTPASGSSGKATAALVLGIVGIVTFWLFGVVPILAIVFGVLGRRDVKRSLGALGGRGKATAGLVLGIVGLALFGGMVALVVASGDKVSASDLEVGQCVKMPELGDDTVSSFTTQDCAGPHGGEVFAVERLDGDSFPGLDEVTQASETLCTDRFEDFVGVPSSESRYDVFYLYPTKDTWDHDQTVACLVYDRDGDTTGTLRDAGR